MSLFNLGRWGRASVVTGWLTFGCGAAAMAADADITPTATTSPVLDPLAPSSLMAGPSLRETGKVGVMPESAAPPEALTPSVMPWAGDAEKSIQPVAAGFADAPPPRPPSGTIDPMLLNREVSANMTKVEQCPLEVARTRQVPPSQIEAESLLLRWTINPAGETGSTDVVATAPVDRDVMSCAKSAMSQWRFTPPRGGSMQVERTVSFRRL